MFVGCRGVQGQFCHGHLQVVHFLIKVVVICVSCIQKQSGSVSSTGSWPGGVVSVECDRLVTVVTSVCKHKPPKLARLTCSSRYFLKSFFQPTFVMPFSVPMPISSSKGNGCGDLISLSSPHDTLCANSLRSEAASNRPQCRR